MAYEEAVWILSLVLSFLLIAIGVIIMYSWRVASPGV